LGALLGSAASGGGGPLGALLQGLKKLLSGQGGNTGSVQGDSPYGGGALMGPDTLLSGYEQTPDQSWNSRGLPWEQPFLTSDPGFYTGMGFPQDPSQGSGIGPGMQRIYGGGGHPLDDPFGLGNP